MQITQTVQAIVDRIVQTVDPLRVILFGSAARGDLDENSDLDFLVVMPEGTRRRQTARKLYRALYGVGVAKDIIVSTENDLERFRNDPGYIYRQALEEGIELYHV